MGRVLGRVRLSRSTEESTSEARQRESIEGWARLHGHEIIGWAVDMDVSGAVSPFDAPALGPWLSRLDEWDILCTYRLDRVARRVIPLNRLFGLCLDHGKRLFSVTESLDLDHWVGRMVANVIAGVAEGELEAIGERTRGSQRKIRELGRWHGGNVPYGYRAVQRDGGWYLETNPDTAKVAREIIRRAADRESIRSIADDLNAREIPAPRGGGWTPQTLTRMIRSRWIIGQAEHNGRVVTGDDGMPLQRTAPIIPFGEWQNARSALSDRSRPKRQRNPQGLLLGVALCAGCREPLYHHVMNKPERGQSYRYWRCSGRTKKRNDCTARARRAEKLESEMERLILDEIGLLERTERVYVLGEDHADELEQVAAAIDGARRERDAGLYDGDEDSYLDRMRGLVDRRRSLQEMPVRKAGYVIRGMGETFGEAWRRGDVAFRREILVKSGIRALVYPPGSPIGGVLLTNDEDLQREFPGYQRPPLGQDDVDITEQVEFVRSPRHLTPAPAAITGNSPEWPGE